MIHWDGSTSLRDSTGLGLEVSPTKGSGLKQGLEVGLECLMKDSASTESEMQLQALGHGFGVQRIARV